VLFVVEKFLMKRILLLVLIACAAAVLWTAPARAQKATPSDDQVNAIARQLYCPVCENIPLDVCPTQACAQWRALIRQKLEAGWSEAQIKQYFVEQYGARVLNEPPRQGWNWLIYILPVIFIAGGAYVLFRLFRGGAQAVPAETPLPPSAPLSSPEGAPGEGTNTDEYLSRFEQEAGEQK
jgi:cytochrome c-type biogenesis protein CcmH